MKPKLLKICYLGLFLISLFTIQTKADYYSEFVVTPHLPSNQREGVVGYFDLLLNPNDQQTILVDIKNTGNSKMDAAVEIVQSTTGRNGSKQYLEDIALDESLKFPIASVAKLKQNRIQIAGGETKTVEVDLTMPSETMDGVLLGAIRVYAENTTSDKTDANIANRLNYIVALQMRNNDNNPSLNLNLIDYGATLDSHLPVFFANVQNDQTALMNDLKITGKISKSNSDVIYSEIELENRSIVPNSNFNVIFDLKDNKMISGNFDMYLKIENEDQFWEWKESFTVQKDESKEINDEALIVKETNWSIIIIGVLIVVILILLLILLLLILKRRKQEEQDDTIKK